MQQLKVVHENIKLLTVTPAVNKLLDVCLSEFAKAHVDCNFYVTFVFVMLFSVFN